MDLDSKNTQNIMNLDLTHSKLNLTLREMIIDIKDIESKKVSFFHAINLSWKGGRVSFSVLPSKANSARMIIDGIIPYLHSIYGGEVLDCKYISITRTGIKL